MIKTKEFRMFEAELLKKFKTRTCLIPGCNSHQIIKAHTIQKSRSLEQIARFGNVYQYKIDVSNSHDYCNYGYTNPKSIGKGNATTFTCFCAQHDRDVFSPIETAPIIPTDQQIFLLMLRAFARELYEKNAAVNATLISSEFVQSTFCNEDPELYSNLEDMVAIQNKGFDAGHKVMELEYQFLVTILETQDYSSIEYLFFEIHQIPEIMGSLVVSPEYTPNNCEIQILAKERNFESFAMTIFADGSKGYIIFSWNKSHKRIFRFFIDLLAQIDIPNTIANMVFSYGDNIAFSPDWWDKLSNIKKQNVCNRVFDIYNRDLETYAPIIFSNIKKLVSWDIIRAGTNSLQLVSNLKFQEINATNNIDTESHL